MSRQLFSVISPVYNVARYLNEYFASLEAQTIGIDRLQIILVDDGSTDESLDMCHEFAARHPDSVRVFHQENAGQSAARNLGLTQADAPWITFPDPDDVLSDNYFTAIHDFMHEPESAQTVVFAGHLTMWDEVTGKRSENHPTSFRFRIGNSTTDLRGKPNFIHGNGNTSFFRRDIVAEHNLRFPESLRTRFEDARFLFEYLLRFDEPILGLIDEARYYYRRRADNSSTVQTADVDPRSYTDVPIHGYLAVLRLARELKQQIPRWMQWFIIYDSLWLFRSDAAKKLATRSVPPEALEAFHVSMREVMTFIEPESVRAFDMMGTPQWMREALTHGYSDQRYVGPVYVGPVDAARELVQIRYRHTHDRPEETVFVRGKSVEARYNNTLTRDILGRTMLMERTLWVSTRGVMRFELDGRMQPLVFAEPHTSMFKSRRSDITQLTKRRVNRVPARFRQIDERMIVRARTRFRQWAKRRAHALRLGNLQNVWLTIVLRSFVARRAYAGAWVLMDREFDANDSAEQFYRWIRVNKPNRKVRFVIRRESSDWARLKRDGFDLVDYGSFRWKLLMLLAAHVISSHADHYITDPLPVRRYGPPQWKMSFLQHGIIKGDLSPWLNGKSLDLFVASTEPEYQYITGESPYKFGSKEVRLTGLPRHDALLAKSKQVPGEHIDQILIAPTWRQYITGKFKHTSLREMNAEFMDTDYARSWKSLVQSTKLRDFAEEHRLKLVFMPHPIIQPYIGDFEVPDWVETRLYGEVDVQDVVCRSAVMITDYSSIAFNMAYLQKPVVYYQFDKARYDAEHTEGKGYYDYVDDGFGPVVSESADVVEALDSLWTDPEVAATYAKRADHTFPVRDGKNSERVYKAIRELDRPLSFSRATQPAPLDSWEALTAEPGVPPA